MAGLISTTRAIELQPALEAYTTAEIEAVIDSVSAFIENYCGRKFAQETVTNELGRTDQFGYFYLARTPVTGSITLKDSRDQTIETYVLNTVSGEVYCPSRPDQYLKASYLGGYATMPPGVEVAVASMTLRACERLRRATDVAATQIGTVKTDYATYLGFKDAMDGTVKALLSPFWRGSL